MSSKSETPKPEVSKLYGDRVTIEFDETKYRDRYNIRVDGRRVKVPSVTVITGTMNKPALVPWAVNQTLGVLEDSILPGCSYTSEELTAIYEKAKNQANWEKKKAANIGTVSHAWIEGWVKGDIKDLPDKDAPHRHCIDAIIKWTEAHHVKFVSTERTVYSIQHSFVGRLDAIAEVDGEVCLVDYKTSNGIWPEMCLQVAAYQAAYEEETEESLAHRWVIRLGKESGQFHKHKFTKDTRDRDYLAFLGLKTAYDATKDIGKQLREAEKQARTESGQMELDWLASLEQEK